jgi:tRNA modification GTPase
MRRAREAASRADLVLWVADAREFDGAGSGLDSQGGRWIVANKIDLLEGEGRQRLESTIATYDSVHLVSALTGDGLDRLVVSLVKFAEKSFSLEPAVVTRERQRKRLSEVVTALDAASARAAEGAGEELVAEHLRQAVTSLGKLTGRVEVEDILDVIFRDFCIGK